MINKWIIDVKQENFFAQFAESDIYGYNYTVQTTPVEYSKYVFVNTIPADELNELKDFIFKSTLYGNILNISVYEKCANPFNIKITVRAKINTDNTLEDMGIIERDYNPSIMEGYDSGKERFNKMINSNVSFQLLRTNPKLTGNIKVVVTEDSNLYLDTFKVSLALGQYKYRHVPVNPNEYYGKALMHFRKMSTDDFYKVEDNCFNLFTTVNDYKMQYYTMYNSGVKTNNDNLYTENYALLAPLCIKEIIPDFFLIFKVNTDTLNRNKNIPESEKIKYFLKKGELIKSFDFRDDTNLGKYVRGIRDNAKIYSGDIFASYDIKNYNKFIGISIERGVVTSAYESLYKEKDINNQVALNEYYTLGFERNKLVSKDIINFEFMFNDTEENLFSINTYFGVYVILNGEKDTFSCIGHDGVYIFDKKDLHNIPSGNEMLKDDYSNLIYGISTPDKFIRLNESIYDSSIMDNFMLKPYRSIITGEYRNLSEDINYEYISVTLNKNIKIGEHFRIVDLKNAVIYDVISTNRTKYLRNNLSEICQNYVWYRRMRFTIKTISAFFEGDLENQILILTRAFIKFKIENSTIKSLNNSFSIKTFNTNCLFEKVSSVSDYTHQNEHFLMDYTDDDNSLTFFGHIYPEKLIIKANDISSPDNNYFYLYPYYTESTGYRIVYVGNFIKVSSNHLNHAVVSKDINNINNKTIVYLDNDNISKLYDSFNINIYKFENGIIEAPLNVNYLLSYDLESYIINVNNPKIYNDSITLYNTYPINSGLCSILQLKDFYFDVLDSDTKLNYFNNIINTGAVTKGGEFTKPYMSNDVPLLNKTEEYITDYFDKFRKNDTYLYERENSNVLYNGLNTNEDKHNYYTDLLKANHIYSDISLVSPYTCKWKGIGTDARGERMRIMYSYDTSVLNNALSYYIPYDTSDILYNDKKLGDKVPIDMFCEQSGFVETDNNSNDYIKYLYKISNTLLSEINGEGISIKDAILSGRISIDDILYYNSITRNKFSIAYKAGDNAIEFVSAGLKIKIRSANSDVINFNTYAGFQAVLISVPGFSSEHNTNTELIIDEVNKQMAILWYTGTNSIEPDLIKPTNIFKVLHTSPLYESKCVNMRINGIGVSELYLQTPNDTNLNTALCNNTGYLILMNKHICDNNDYSYNNDVMIVSEIPSDTSILYYDPSYITTLHPVIIKGQDISLATNNLIELNTDSYHDGVDMYIVSDSAIYDIHKTPVKSDLKNDLINCGIYVRKAEGAMDYTNLDNFLTFTIVPPYKINKSETVKTLDSIDISKIITTKKQTSGFVQTVYAEPVMVDMYDFNYKDDNINNIFNRVMNGMNIDITNVFKLPQTWINKYTTSSNYCIPLDGSYPRVSIDCLSNMSIMDNCWGNIYHEYYVHDFTDSSIYDNIEWRNDVFGYQTGYEKKNFLGSRGVNLNGVEGNSMDLTVWKNTKVLEKDKCIKLDVSESLIYKILFIKGFSESWKYLGLRSNTYKIKYIKNTILPLLNITSKTVFTFYKMENTKKLAFKDLTSLSNIIQVNNIKNELRYENGKYYMYVYPEEAHTYYAKMHINL